MKNQISNLLLAWSLLLNVWCSTNNLNFNKKINNSINSSKNHVENIVENNSWNNILNLTDDEVNKKIIATKNIIWENEFNYFSNYFDLDTDYEIVEKIYILQENNWLKSDGVIWENTLKYIYLTYYDKESNLPNFIEKKLEIYNDMEAYKYHKWRNTRYWKLFPSKVPSIFSNNYYYWIWKTKNIEDTFLNSDLVTLVNPEIARLWNTAVIYNREWNFFLAVYVDWKLELLTYISPWTDVIKWGMKTLTWNFKTTFSDKFHISWAKDSIKKTDKWLIWAVMPYALHITWGIYSHAWYVNWKRKSHWCIRLPIYYAKWMYEIFENKWKIDWFIYDN